MVNSTDGIFKAAKGVKNPWGVLAVAVSGIVTIAGSILYYIDSLQDIDDLVKLIIYVIALVVLILILWFVISKTLNLTERTQTQGQGLTVSDPYKEMHDATSL